MIRRSLQVAAVLVAVAAPAAAQTRQQPNVLLTIYAGFKSGHQLWSVTRQTLTFEGTTMNPPDTVDLHRQVNSTLMVGGLFQLYRSPGLGYWLEVAFSTFGLDDTCSPVSPFQSDPPGTDAAHRNRTLCDNITARAGGGSWLAIGAGVTLRAVARGAVSPYVRLGGNISFTTAGTIEVAAPEALGGLDRIVIRDDAPRRLLPGVLLVSGLSVALAPGYQIRLELRDQIESLEHVDGPANALGVAPSSSRMFHQFGLALGIDIVLEHKRGRRY